MLRINIFLLDWRRYVQSGAYVDFICKQAANKLVRRVYIYTTMMFSEKYCIEFITRKIINGWLFNMNRWTAVTSLYRSYFFVQLVSFFIYGWSLSMLLCSGW